MFEKGSIDGSKSVPNSTLLESDGTMKSKDEICAIFSKAGIDTTKPVIFCCMTGVKAS